MTHMATEKYALNSTEFVGVTIRMEDESPLDPSIVRLAALDYNVQSPPPSTTWLTPDFTQQINPYTVVAKVLRGPSGTLTLPVGTYRMWARLLDSPEDAWLPSPQTFKVV